jgi:hypothetical protein
MMECIREDFKGNDMICVPTGEFKGEVNYLKMGYRKAKAVLEHVEEIEAFCIEQEIDDYLANDRLCGQIKRIYDLMSDGRWRSLAEIERATGDPQASISAQIRHLRKDRFGGHRVEKRRRGESGTWEYQVDGDEP